jgi:signal transduction histidine kinase
VATSPRRPLSLRTHLLFLVVGTLLPAVLLGTLLVQQLVAANRATIERRLLEASRATAALVDAEITATVRTLQALSRSQRLDDGNLAGFYREATEVQATQPTWAAIVLRDRDGTSMVNTFRPWGAPPIATADTDGIRRVLTTQKPVIGNLRQNLGYRSMPVVPIRVPVVRDGTVRYVLTALINPDRLDDLLRQEHSFPDEWVRGALDADNVIVARTRDPERWVGRPGTPGFVQRIATSDEMVYRDVSLEGQPVYGAFTRAPMSRWVAGVAVPAASVDGEFRRSMWLLGLLAMIALGLGGGAAFFIARRMSRDISLTAEAADALAIGRDPILPASSVTEVQRLSDALTRASALLQDRERELDARVSRADAARAEAEAADRAKDEFMAMLGHELRNPLAPALTALQVVKRRGGQFAAHECDIVERQVRHLARLVDDLLDVSRLRRGAIDLRREPVQMAAVVARAVEMASPLVEERHHHLTVDVPDGLVVDGDQQRLAQVFTNLIANAAKYTEPGGHITLSARAEDDTVVVECTDDGIGIAPALLPRIFDLFVQGERGLDRRQGGLGLGLAVARTLVERHGGTIAVRSDGVGHGSTFMVRLPAGEPRRLMTPARGLPRSAGVPRGTRVLVVEDNPDALEMLVQSLALEGLDVTAAGDAASALAQAATRMPQVAILDIGLPQVDGYDLARQIRQQAGTARPWLIALTGYGGQSGESAANAAGFDALLVKPVSVDVLLGHIAALLASGAVQG